jgi:hypothetical protein
VKKPLINKEKMNKKEFKVSESIPTLPSFLILFPYAVSSVVFTLYVTVYYPLCYTVWKVVKRGVVGAKNH